MSVPVKTPRIVSPPSVMLVGLDDVIAEAVRTRLNPIPVMRAAHLAAAAERIPLTRPLMIVVANVTAGDDFDQVRDVARGCGTAVVVVDDLLAASEDVPRYIEQLVISHARRRSGQYASTEPRKKK